MLKSSAVPWGGQAELRTSKGVDAGGMAKGAGVMRTSPFTSSVTFESYETFLVSVPSSVKWDIRVAMDSLLPT